MVSGKVFFNIKLNSVHAPSVNNFVLCLFFLNFLIKPLVSV